MPQNRVSSAVPSHRRARRRWLLTLWLVVTLAGACVVAAGGLPAVQGWQRGCAGAAGTTITVVAAPAIAPTLTALAARWTADRANVAAGCLAASVVSKPANQVAAALGATWDPARDGARPQVWIPESSLWLAVAATRPATAAMLPKDPASIASSPTVLALRQPVAQALGWPQRTLAWPDVIGAFSRPGAWTAAGHPEWETLRIGIADPSASTAALASLLSIFGGGAQGAVPEAQLTAGLALTRTLGAVAPDTDALFAAQRSPDTAGPNGIVAAFPALESDVATYAGTNPPGALVPIYAPRPVTADFPYTVLSTDWVSPADRAGAEDFRDYLLTPDARDAFGSIGLRTPDGQAARADTLPVSAGFPATVAPAPAPPDPAAISAVVTEWANLQRQVNLLAVLDTSGSMAERVPGTALTRLQLLQQTATTGFSLLTNRTSIGLWDFSARPGSASRYRELVPFGTLAGRVGTVSRGEALPAAVAALRPAGSTPLYDTLYAAFHEMQRHWQPGSSNAVLLITDGVNELNGGLSLAGLLERLRAEQRPDQPVQIVTIALGTDADAGALQQVAQATGGRTYVIRDVATAIQTLILAFTGRLQ